MRTTPPPPGSAARRVADEASIVELVVLHGYAVEALRGDVEFARREARAALERWIGQGLAYARGDDGARRFDPAEVSAFFKHAGRERGDPYLRERAIPESRRFALAFHPGSPSVQAPPPVRTLPRERFVVTHEREFDLSRGAPGAPTLLRLPLPVPEPAIDVVDVAFLGPAGATTLQAPGRLDVRLPHPGTRTTTLGVRVAFDSDPSREPEPFDAADAALYLRPAEGLVKASPRVAALAERLAGATREPFDVLRRFVDYVIEEVAIAQTSYDDVDPAAPLDGVLAGGWADCQLSTALVVAMCRLRGLPARLVSGYLLIPAPAVHYWGEVAIDGRWRPFDVLVADLSDGGRDAAWRDYYVGRLDHRVKTQVLPRTFNLAPSVRMPARWHQLPRIDGDGTSTATVDTATGALVFRDRLAVQRGASVNATPL
jgi:transglutaminase-like putative cysteine protease